MDPDASREWHRQVIKGYETPAEADHWIAGASGGWTAAEGRLVEQFVRARARVLVVGCGGGRELVALERRACEGTGIEVARKLLLRYRRSGGRAAGHVLLADMAAEPFRARSFDVVLLFNQVLGHAPGREDRIATLSEALRLLRPGGVVLLSFYARSVEDYSLWLGAWSIWSRKGPGHGPSPTAIPGGGPARSDAVQRRIQAWLRGKADRTRRCSRRILLPTRATRGHVGDITLSPSARTGRATEGRVPFHLYRLDEFFEDVRSAGGLVVLWRSNAELNAGSTAPTFLRGLDNLHFCALASNTRRDQR